MSIAELVIKNTQKNNIQLLPTDLSHINYPGYYRGYEHHQY